MSSKNWKCFQIHTKSRNQLNILTRDLVELMKQLRKKKQLERYFFNRYTNDRKSEFFIKLGLVNSDKKVQSKLNNLLKKHSVLKSEPYDCEMWEVNGVPIDFIKCISCELFEKTKEAFKEKPLTLNQLGYLLHFLMNQLGLGYENELELYKSLEQSIEKQLKESQKN